MLAAEALAFLRARDDSMRFVRQAAHLAASETSQSDGFIRLLHQRSVDMMTSLDAARHLDLDVTAIGFDAETGQPYPRWRRTIGEEIWFTMTDASGRGERGGSVVRVAVRYRYPSLVSALTGIRLSRRDKAWAAPPLGAAMTLNGLSRDNEGRARALPPA